MQELAQLNQELKSTVADLQSYFKKDVMVIIRENQALKAMYAELRKSRPSQRSHQQLKEAFRQANKNCSDAREYARKLEETVENMEQKYQGALAQQFEANGTRHPDLEQGIGVALENAHRPMPSSPSSPRALQAMLNMSHVRAQDHTAERQRLQVKCHH